MVPAMRLDRDVPVVHGDQVHLEAEGRERAPRPGAGATGAAEQVSDKGDSSFLGCGFRRHLLPPAHRSMRRRPGSAVARQCIR